MNKDYIARYRDKYPNDNYICDDDLIDSSMYSYFVFHEAVIDFAKCFAGSIKLEINNIKKYFF